MSGAGGRQDQIRDLIASRLSRQARVKSRHQAMEKVRKKRSDNAGNVSGNSKMQEQEFTLLP